MSGHGITDHGTVHFSRAEIYQVQAHDPPLTVLRFINDEKSEAIACSIPRDPFVQMMVRMLMDAFVGAADAMSAELSEAVRQASRDS